MSATPAAPARGYEQLQGGQGRSIYYRAERVRPRMLLHRLTPSVEVDAHPVEVCDLSATGLSFWAAPDAETPNDGVRVPVRLRLGAVEAFSVEGEIVRHQPIRGRTKVALRFVDDRLAAARLRRIHDHVVFEQAASEGLDRFRAVPPAYREVCGDLRLFVDHWQQLLDRREAQIRESEPREAWEERLAEVERSAEPRMVAEWSELRDRANEVCNDVTEGDVLVACKRLTETMLTPGLHVSPFIWRCYTKPQGYPGDFQAMTWMYEGQRQGESVFARILDQIGLDERLAATVRVRKRLLLRHIAECVEDRADGGEGPVRIVSIGSGPAREIVDFLGENELRAPVEFLLIDQDEQALAFAAEHVGRAALRHRRRATIQLRHVSFAQLFSLPELLGEVRGADMIYSAGLFDYLRAERAQTLLQGLHGLLAADGRLLVGNVAAVPGLRWMAEFVVDWTMVYRTEAEMASLGDALGGSFEIERDESDTWLFLAARKPTPDSGA